MFYVSLLSIPGDVEVRSFFSKIVHLECVNDNKEYQNRIQYMTINKLE